MSKWAKKKNGFLHLNLRKKKKISKDFSLSKERICIMSSEPLWNRRRVIRLIPSSWKYSKKSLKFSRVNIKIAKRCKCKWLTLNIFLLLADCWLLLLCLRSSFDCRSWEKKISRYLREEEAAAAVKNWESNNRHTAKAMNEEEKFARKAKLLRWAYEAALCMLTRQMTLLFPIAQSSSLSQHGYKYGKWTFFYFSRFEVVDKFRFNSKNKIVNFIGSPLLRKFY